MGKLGKTCFTFQKVGILFLMPEDTLKPTSNIPNQPSPEAKKFNPIFLITGILVLIVILVLTFFYLATNRTSKDQIVTGLEKDQIRLGWTSLTGTYPNNSSPPTTDDNNINDAVFEALTKFRGSTIAPALAVKWTNPNETTWRFDIRKNVKFHSGNNLTIEDIKYSFDQVLSSAESEDTAWPSSSSVATIKQVIVVDQDTIDIETKEPDPLLLTRITDVFILSKKQVEKDGISKAVGTGPFSVVSYEKDTRAVLTRNNNYWGTKPKLKEATFTIYDTDEALLKAINKGEIDYARVGLADVTAPSGYEVIKKEQPRVVMLFINFATKKVSGKDNPLLNKKVREAIKLSLDTTKLIKEASVSGTVANQFLTSSIVGYNSSIQTTSRNIPKAKSILSEEKINNLTFDLHVTPDRQTVAEAVKKQLAEAGITVNIEVEASFGELVDKLFAGEASSFIAGPVANDGGEYIAGIFRTEADQNILSYSNETVDTSSIEANRSFSPRERRKLLEDLSLVIVNDIPVIPLYAVTDNFLVKNNIDFDINSLSDFILESVSGKKTQKNTD